MNKLKFWEKIFIDKNGNYVGFSWWFKWAKAYWAWRYWLRYEGMPRDVYDVDKMLEWQRKLIEKQ